MNAPVVLANPVFGEPPTQVAMADVSRARQLVKRRGITTGPDLSSLYFAPLSGTGEEARSLKTLFPDATVLVGAHATKASLKSLSAPGILHIATHGFFLNDAGAAKHVESPLLRSGLALAGANLSKNGNENGILTALEASSLDLWGTRVVTLSACETGVGEVKNGEGVYGLRRSFFLAGAETLVMSLWPVSDRITREMMISYYTGLKQGLSRGEALRQAQLNILKRKDRQHPFFWASFIQLGEWKNLDGN
jgi:CHAT domain-containing protein